MPTLTTAAGDIADAPAGDIATNEPPPLPPPLDDTYAPQEEEDGDGSAGRFSTRPHVDGIVKLEDNYAPQEEEDGGGSAGRAASTRPRRAAKTATAGQKDVDGIVVKLEVKKKTKVSVKATLKATKSTAICIVDGCGNKVSAKGGELCIAHGGEAPPPPADKPKRRICTHADGCTNLVVQGGVCLTHGAKVRLCSHIDPDSGAICTKQAKKGGVCITHGAEVKRCTYAGGCNNHAIRDGVCITHGAGAKLKPRKKCTTPGCPNNAKRGGVCITHGAMKQLCSFDGCQNKVVKGGICITHGAAKQIKKTCSFPGGCVNKVQKEGVCKRHYHLKDDGGVGATNDDVDGVVNDVVSNNDVAVAAETMEI